MSDEKKKAASARVSVNEFVDDDDALLRELVMDEIEQGLAQTLADLGIEDTETPAQSNRFGCGELVLPQIVRCSLPLDSPDIRDIYDSFVKRLNGRLPEFRKAWDEKNYDSLRDLGHWLAGAAGTIGLDDLVPPARELEYSDWTDPLRDEAVLEYILELATRIETTVSP